MPRREIGLLGYALLGLLHENPSSGYALRRVFGLTPMSAFSDSPGAIYPALRRLEKGGLVRGREEKSSGSRRRRVFQLTASGLAELRKWLAVRPGREDVMRRLEELSLRFAFMDQVMGKSASIHFLEAMALELEAYIPTLHRYLGSAKDQMPLSAQLALQSGIRGYEAQLRWTREARAAYEKRK
jgi:DNA-binding PadR family transcriptional regulator